MITIALAGNPNSGKTTLFNALTGSNQFVGNWPGVTVEKKTGHYKGDKEVAITDLPGIYSLSPYTLEEVVARNYLINEKPDGIIDIVDGTNLERNLYLTTQLLETGIPVVVAVNMMDLVRKNGDKIDIKKLSKELGCPVVEISALKNEGIGEAVEAAKKAVAAKSEQKVHKFSAEVEKYLTEIEDRVGNTVPQSAVRFVTIKLFEKDSRIHENYPSLPDVSALCADAEKELDDDTESIITGERYDYIGSMIGDCYKKAKKGEATISDKIDRIVTNRILALPIFALVMFIVYYVSVTTVGGILTDWANDGVFGDGWFLLGIGRDAYDEDVEGYDDAQASIEAYDAVAQANEILAASIGATIDMENEDGETEAVEVTEALQAEATETLEEYLNEDGTVVWQKWSDEEDEETGLFYELIEVTAEDYAAALEVEEPDPSDYGPWIIGIPALLDLLIGEGAPLDCTGTFVYGLIMDGIVAGVGAVLGFVPQMLVLFIFLAFLESCGYMARIAFIMDRLFRRFGLSGKSFIPMLIGSGCGIPGIMASRTIENEKDRRMTIMTTTFIPCGAKLPIIALFAGAVFNNSGLIAVSAYFIGIAAIVVTGIILKKTKLFAGDPAPFVMELPAYHLPTVGNVLRSMWERGWSFIKKAGTVILLSTIVIWFTSNYTITLKAVDEFADTSILGWIGNHIAWIFSPLGWGDGKAAIAAVTGLVAKENVVGTFGILYGADVATEGGSEIWANVGAYFTGVTAYSFMVFNLLCAPCFAAMGAIKREMNNGKWTAFAITYQCVFAYLVALCINQFGRLFDGRGVQPVGLVVAIIVLVGFIYMLFRPNKYADANNGITAEPEHA
ncbi:MAG: ferrous iron transporter B [Lachnospiraceae bacterium]|nr:ferrous iron transporter B [Lachnospiraceae bacterium]